MPRIPYKNLAELPPEERAAIGENPLNIARILAVASGPVRSQLLGMLRAFNLDEQSSLPAKLREIAILRVSYTANSTYAIFQHETFARRIGMTDTEIAAVKAGQGGGVLDASQVAVMNFVDDVVKNVRAGNATLAAARTHLSDTQIIDLIILTGVYMLGTRVMETAGIELDTRLSD